MLILLWIVSFFASFFLIITLIYFFIFLKKRQCRPFTQACEQTVDTAIVYPLNLLVCLIFMLTMIVLLPIYWIRGR
ncbi:hypothetical protein [Bacillus sp. NPDC077027]|uniref:hypothetical protein n=1 Tax=Bacillus sp. NPDC077027 TaxID=3390548 RepID=UPI003D039D7C